MAAILADPATRAQHVEAIANFAAVHNFQGIDIDYENFAFEDDREHVGGDPPELGGVRPGARRPPARRRADPHRQRARRSTTPVRPTDSGYWVYDYGGIAPSVDAIRIMAYD